MKNAPIARLSSPRFTSFNRIFVATSLTSRIVLRSRAHCRWSIFKMAPLQFQDYIKPNLSAFCAINLSWRWKSKERLMSAPNNINNNYISFKITQSLYSVPRKSWNGLITFYRMERKISKLKNKNYSLVTDATNPLVTGLPI